MRSNGFAEGLEGHHIFRTHDISQENGDALWDIDTSNLDEASK